MFKFILLSVFAFSSAHASEDFWGFWSPKVIQKKNGLNYQANAWKFQIKNSKLSKFISCVKKNYPQSAVYLYGFGTDDISKPESKVLKRAEICTSSRSGGKCDGEFKSTCP